MFTLDNITVCFTNLPPPPPYRYASIVERQIKELTDKHYPISLSCKSSEPRKYNENKSVKLIPNTLYMYVLWMCVCVFVCACGSVRVGVWKCLCVRVTRWGKILVPVPNDIAMSHANSRDCQHIATSRAVSRRGDVPDGPVRVELCLTAPLGQDRGLERQERERGRTLPHSSSRAGSRTREAGEREGSNSA